jgi:MFS family permease
MLLQDIGGFIGILSFTALATWVGRRAGFTVAFLGGFASIFLVFMALSAEWHVYVMLPIMGFFTIGVMGGFVIYFPEIFPTRFRSTGTAFGYNVARLSAAVVMLLGNNIRSGLDQMGFAHPFRVGAVVLSGIYLLGLLVLIWAPETRGQPLPDED